MRKKKKERALLHHRRRVRCRCRCHALSNPRQHCNRSTKSSFHPFRCKDHDALFALPLRRKLKESRKPSEGSPFFFFVEERCSRESSSSRRSLSPSLCLFPPSTNHAPPCRSCSSRRCCQRTAGAHRHLGGAQHGFEVLGEKRKGEKRWNSSLGCRGEREESEGAGEKKKKLESHSAFLSFFPRTFNSYAPNSCQGTEHAFVFVFVFSLSSSALDVREREGSTKRRKEAIKGELGGGFFDRRSQNRLRAAAAALGIRLSSISLGRADLPRRCLRN